MDTPLSQVLVGAAIQEIEEENVCRSGSVEGVQVILNVHRRQQETKTLHASAPSNHKFLF